MKKGIKKKFSFNQKIVIIVAVVVLVVFLLNLFYWFFLPRVQLIGDHVVRVEFGEKYEDQGYRASLGGVDLGDYVEVSNNINYDELGKYKIEYNLEYENSRAKTERTVMVIDAQAPKISLKGEDPGLICPNKSFIETGYGVEDNYDGDITDKVLIKEKSDKIEYIVKDSSGNKSISQRELVSYDGKPPVISLAGGNLIQILVGDNFEEPGFSASDVCDGDVTDKVKIKNEINKDQAGEYKVRYSVQNSLDDSANIERTVRVREPWENDIGVIYLTFDDGPSDLTPEILDILEEEDVKATFFIICRDDSLNHIIKRAFDEGHTVAAHTCTHNFKQVYASEEAYFHDLEVIRGKIELVTGQKTNFVRFPGGGSNTISKFNPRIMSRLTKQVQEKGFTYFDWNVSAGDADGVKSKSGIYKNIVDNLSLERSNVVLLHDAGDKIYTIRALKDVIQYGKKHGYVFSAINNRTAPIMHGVNN
jgi:Predicted xylanase/chitin deacetylase